MINYGVILGVLLILVSVIFYALGQTYKPSFVFSALQFIIPLVIIFMGIKQFRQLNGDALSLSEALKTGLGISLIGGIILAVYNFVFAKFIEPDYFVKVLEIQQNQMIEANPNLSDEQIEMATEMSGMFANVWVMIGSAIMLSLFGGLIYSLISGLILKKDKQ